MPKILIDFEYGNSRIYNNLGSSPKNTVRLCDWLKSNKNNLASIKFAMYLFNNKYLFNTLKELASEGITVDVYSIPLEGYDDDKPIDIKDHNTGESLGRQTKYQLAEVIYSEIINHPIANFTLHIFPHMYLRSSRVRAFSRGNMPYSLHCKTCLFKFKDGTTYVGLTSSNVAVRDAQKIELFNLETIEGADVTSAEDFYSGLDINSIEVNSFDPEANYNHYEIAMRPAPPISRVLYTAPFYENSAQLFEERIIQIINRANSRIVVAAQHVCAYDYSYYTNNSSRMDKPGFLSTVLDKARNGIPTTILSQTYADKEGNHGCRSPENKTAFINFTTAAKAISSCQYFVNSNLHAKFIIVDDIVITTTCNFTPTQFIYIPNVNIPEFDNIPNTSYSGIFCEVGAYFIYQIPQIADALFQKTNDIIALETTRKMF
ncbi:MAG: hypothetical protein V8T13_09825 [[Ruminococcus] lactaris]